MADNPYQAPEAVLADTGPAATPEELQEPHRVGAGRGVAWIGEALRLFGESWLVWVGMALVTGLLLVLTAMIPVLNLANTVIMSVFVGGFMLAANEAHAAGDAPFGTLFHGFRDHFVRLAGVGVLNTLGVFVPMVLMFAILFSLGGLGVAMEGGELDPETAARMPQAITLAALGGMALMVPFLMATWFAPALVAIHGADLLSAFRMSFMGCLRNIPAFLVYGLVFLVVGGGLAVAVAALAAVHVAFFFVVYFGSLLILGPVGILTMYTAHRDIYLAPEEA